ncbi:hypothetical protein NP233_g2486 [Leucocoprinus birnbaumii]|uniref:Uncharacterized protein n=1 Tax=Leucocoprinus birnbaumii TaxID=56174 RepID=A0AAD5VY72_9AGAR|nr:hypothetical protein NP233_g2486 [Leucocoprinus birnbaumii]
MLRTLLRAQIPRFNLTSAVNCMPNSSNKRPRLDEDILIVEDSEPEREVQRHPQRFNQKLDRSVEVLDLSDSYMDTAFKHANVCLPLQSARLSPTPPPPSLSRFALQDPCQRAESAKTRTAPVTNAPKVASRKGEISRAMVIRNQKRAFLSSINASEKDISTLKHCVCCRERWQVKKKVKEKLSHVEACAKQHAYTSETLAILIKKELNKDAGPLPEVTVPQETRLETVIQDALPNRKGRTKKKTSTLQAISDQTRADAKERLRAVLGPPINLNVEGQDFFFPTSTQAVTSSSNRRSQNAHPIVYRPSRPPPSPATFFLPSRLSQARGRGGVHIYNGSPFKTRSFRVSRFHFDTVPELIAHRIAQPIDLS